MLDVGCWMLPWRGFFFFVCMYSSCTFFFSRGVKRQGGGCSVRNVSCVVHDDLRVYDV